MNKPTDQEMIAVEILTSLVSQIQVSMVTDKSPLTNSGMVEIIQRLKLANELLSES